MSDDNQHTADVRSIAEGNEVILSLDSGRTIEAACIERNTIHEEEGPHITQQDVWVFEDDGGSEYSFIILEGLSGTPGKSPFPEHSPVAEEQKRKSTGLLPEDALLGYVTSVSFESEPTGADPDGTVDTGV